MTHVLAVLGLMVAIVAWHFLQKATGRRAGGCGACGCGGQGDGACRKEGAEASQSPPTDSLDSGSH
jgi:hypothetical protein